MRIPGLDTLKRTDPTAAGALEALIVRLAASAEASTGALDEVGAFASAGDEGAALELLVQRARSITGAAHVAALRWTGALQEGTATIDHLAGDAEVLGEDTPSLAGVSSTLLGRVLEGGRPVWRDRSDGGQTLATSASLADIGSAGCIAAGRHAALYLSDPRPGAFSTEARARVQALCIVAGAFLGSARPGPTPRAGPAPTIPGLVGDTPAMHELYAAVRAFAAVPWPALVLGETGTGKEAIARALHTLSPRAAHPFLAFNAATVTPELAESLLFGHERGAFTGADRRREGMFERVGQGTLFLDEVGELPARVQASLLRVLQERRFERVGGAGDLAFRGRIVAATWRPVDDPGRRGEFRSDLFHRLGACILRIPPLRARREDIPALANHLLARAAAEIEGGAGVTISPAAMAVLRTRTWPGNVRELENTLREALARAVALHTKTVGPEAVADRSSPVDETTDMKLPDGTRPLDMLDATDRYQQQLVRNALEACGGNRTEAAAYLGVSRPWLYRLLQRWGGEP